MSLTVALLIAALAAIGIVLILGFLSYDKLVQKLRDSHSDFFKAKIKKNYTTMGVEVIDVKVEDVFGRTIADESYAGLDGVSGALYTGREIYK